LDGRFDFPSDRIGRRAESAVDVLVLRSDPETKVGGEILPDQRIGPAKSKKDGAVAFADDSARIEDPRDGDPALDDVPYRIETPQTLDRLDRVISSGLIGKLREPHQRPRGLDSERRADRDTVEDAAGTRLVSLERKRDEIAHRRLLGLVRANEALDAVMKELRPLQKHEMAALDLF